jgi:hypothetical protein
MICLIIYLKFLYYIIQYNIYIYIYLLLLIRTYDSIWEGNI